jgi:hypothetical protein
VPLFKNKLFVEVRERLDREVSRLKEEVGWKK